VANYYAANGHKIINVDSEKPVDEVTKAVIAKLDELSAVK
jgi:hypothetical protein